MSSDFKGKMTVVAIVALGLVLAASAYAWWTMQGRAMQAAQRGGQSAGAVAWDEDKARDEAAWVGDLFKEAVAEHKDTAPMLAAAQRLVEKYPQFAEARTLLGQVLRWRGQRAGAIEQLEKSLELNGQQANIHEMVGQLYLEEKNFDRATFHFTQAISLAPAQSNYRLFLAQTQIVQQQYEEARKSLLHILSLDSGQHKAYAMLSDLYARQNKQDLALDQIQKAIENTPIIERDEQVKYIRIKSMLLRRGNQPHEAMMTLAGLSPNERADVGVMADMATCLAMMGEFSSAALIYEEAFADNPADFEMLEKAAQWRIKAQDWQRAAKYLELLRRSRPHSPMIVELEKKLAEQGSGR